MGMDGGVMRGFSPTPIEWEIIEVLRCGDRTIIEIERMLHRERHDPDICRAMDRLKSGGVIQRKGMNSMKFIVWTLK